MNQTGLSTKRVITLLPIVGIVLFVVLYVFSSLLYPGGSQADLSSIGFDWVNNYWCNLMNEKGMNGQLNPARPYAITAMIILCSGLMVFFIQFANAYCKNIKWKTLVITSGIISMSLAMLVFTEYHDLMTMISSFFGLFTVIGIIREVYFSSMVIYKYSGVLCLLLLGINNYLYYSKDLIEVLPMLQKITFGVVLLWIAGLNIKMVKEIH